MKRTFKSCTTAIIIAVIIMPFFSCSSANKPKGITFDSVEANISMYKHTWDEIINHRKLDMFNDNNFNNRCGNAR